jgi:hypothetical protein
MNKIFDFGALIYDQTYFGAYPTQQQIQTLEELEFDLIVNLTFDEEKNIEPYTTHICTIQYSIQDNQIPTDQETFSALIVHLYNLIINHKKIFIHCKGGHGRSCLVSTCIFYYFTKCVARKAITYITQQHNSRMDMSNRWKTIKTPFAKIQKSFLYKFLNPICILKPYTFGYQAGFSSLSNFNIETELGVFPNIDLAFESFKNKYNDPETYPDERIIHHLTRIKYTQYPELRIILLSSGLKHIYDVSRYAFQDNLIGKSLMKYREEMFLLYSFDLKKSNSN